VFAGFGPADASAAKTPSKISISRFRPPPLLGSWEGTIKSDRKACLKNRDITVYRRTGEDNEEIGTGTTNRDGNRWKWLVVGGDDVEGKYFAIASPTAKCKYAESKIFDYPKDNPEPWRAAKAEAKAETTVTIQKWTPGTPPTGEWSGRLSSEKNSCNRLRYIEIFRKEGGKVQGGIGNTTAQKEGHKWIWRLPSPVKVANGKYFVTVTPTEDCRGDESEIYRYPQDNPPPRPY
jgi:hypothetical protein